MRRAASWRTCAAKAIQAGSDAKVASGVSSNRRMWAFVSDQSHVCFALQAMLLIRHSKNVDTGTLHKDTYCDAYTCTTGEPNMGPFE